MQSVAGFTYPMMTTTMLMMEEVAVEFETLPARTKATTSARLRTFPGLDTYILHDTPMTFFSPQGQL